MHRMTLVLLNKINRNAGGAVRVVVGGAGQHQNGAESLGLTAPSWDDCTELGKRLPASSVGGAVKQHGASAPRGKRRIYLIFFPRRLLLVTDLLYHLRSPASFVGQHNSLLAVWHPTNPPPALTAGCLGCCQADKCLSRGATLDALFHGSFGKSGGIPHLAQPLTKVLIRSSREKPNFPLWGRISYREVLAKLEGLQRTAAVTEMGELGDDRRLQELRLSA